MQPLTSLRKKNPVTVVFALAWFALVAGPCVMAEVSASVGQDPERIERVHGDCVTPPTVHSVAGSSDCCDPTFALKTDMVKIPAVNGRRFAVSFFTDEIVDISAAFHSPDGASSTSGLPLYLETLRLRI